MSGAVDAQEIAGGKATLILLRHGESESNASGRLAGQDPGPIGLTVRGIAQAEAAAEAVLARWPSPLAIFGSDLQRVRETVAPLAQRSEAPVYVDPRLREIDYGDWTGLRLSEAAERDPEVMKKLRGGQDVARGGGENFGQVLNRVGRALNWTAGIVVGRAAELGADPIGVVVAHGGTIQAVAVLAGTDTAGPPFGHEEVGNCAISVVHVDVGGVTLDVYDDVAHLSQDMTTDGRPLMAPPFSSM